MALVEFDAPIGQPIYFMVGNNEGAPGDIFFFSMQSPLIITPSIDQNGLVAKDGRAAVSGTATCNRGETGASLPGSIVQPKGSRTAQATLFGGTSADCATGPAAVVGGTYSSNSTPFAPGRATVTVGPVEACDSSGCQPGMLIGRNDGPAATKTIMLRKTK